MITTKQNNAARYKLLRKLQLIVIESSKQPIHSANPKPLHTALHALIQFNAPSEITTALTSILACLEKSIHSRCTAIDCNLLQKKYDQIIQTVQRHELNQQRLSPLCKTQQQQSNKFDQLHHQIETKKNYIDGLMDDIQLLNAEHTHGKMENNVEQIQTNSSNSHYSSERIKEEVVQLEADLRQMKRNRSVFQNEKIQLDNSKRSEKFGCHLLMFSSSSI